ncbi:succinyl-diaminopimelate desuccinylase [Moritella sp. Urea-trap-13]|uniref:succinyl-diaminopimelate desuccinylase n=1 Tax=Moritella sp. Urea-trap-13 TaxID=2058327 RepID=UPI000C34CF92|nr:succinyl-diaminopimelate desuccinylase [Moritella sp. Urea-trap-13]PKH07873.1 succinyl-diaminopimelate desuccinylase [Moritella sp. Urea-trap-13]
MSDSLVLQLAKDLLSRESVTPEDAGCQQMMITRLEELGFTIETMVFEDTTNLWARRGTTAPVFCFAGHTDVVPVGKIEDWDTDPFVPTVIDGYLHGRGAADMKGSIASFLVAVENFVKAHPDHQGSVALLITSDEEGPFINGTTRVIDTLEARNEKIDWCIVGEPSSTNKVGDIVKNGRRGSLTGDIVVKGIQGHVAYPHLAENPIHKLAPALSELSQVVWDQGNDYFPATTLQITDIRSGAGASNIVPGEATCQFNLRYSTELTADLIKYRIEAIFEKYGLNYQISWIHSGQPFLTEPGNLLNAISDSIESVCGYATELSTSGGTSDGRFIAPTGAQVVELGPVNATIHKVNECVKISDIEQLAEIYEQTLVKLLANK